MIPVTLHAVPNFLHCGRGQIVRRITSFAAVHFCTSQDLGRSFCIRGLCWHTWPAEICGVGAGSEGQVASSQLLEASDPRNQEASIQASGAHYAAAPAGPNWPST